MLFLHLAVPLGSVAVPQGTAESRLEITALAASCLSTLTVLRIKRVYRFFLAVYLKSSFFWNLTSRHWVIDIRRFEITWSQWTFLPRNVGHQSPSDALPLPTIKVTSDKTDFSRHTGQEMRLIIQTT